ncbi:MAG: hypothetical protein AB7P67_12370, partial [Vicinamibacterales bacterium]
MAPVGRNLRDLKVSTKLIGASTAVIVAAALLVGWVAYLGVESALRSQAMGQVDAVRASRGRLVVAYFKRIRDDISLASRRLNTQLALRDMPAAVAALPRQLSRSAVADAAPLGQFYEDRVRPAMEAAGQTWPGTPQYLALPEPARLLQTIYLAGNPNPPGQKELLADAGTGTDYDRAHATFHPIARGLTETFGYSDVLLIAVDGTVVYSSEKAIDFGTNVRNGAFRDSGLAQAFERAIGTAPGGDGHFVDFAPYAPAYGAAAAFISAPVFDQDG